MKRRIFRIGIFAVWAICLISAPAFRLLAQEQGISVVLNTAEEEAESSFSSDLLEEAVSPDLQLMAFNSPRDASNRVSFISHTSALELIWEVCSPPPERTGMPSEIFVSFKPSAGQA